MKILTEQQETMLNAERVTLSQLMDALDRFGMTAEDKDTLKKSILQADDFLLLVVVGEFNSGKSVLINALLGERLLEDGVTPTTSQINVVRYGESMRRTGLEDNILLVYAPVDLLKDVSIVDTPGTNAIIREHEILTNQFVPRSDMVLFVTSADRPFTESERAFLEKVRDWGKKVVVVINKVDILQADTDLEKIESFIRLNVNSLLGITPEIFPVSARKALKAKTGEPALWKESRFQELEDYIRSNLDDESKLTLKLLNPLGVGLHLADRYLRVAEGRINLLGEDLSVLDSLERQLKVYETDMMEDFKFRMADIENVLLQMEKRGQEFFEEKMQLLHLLELIDKDHIQRVFEKRVVADVPKQIENKVNELIDWMVENNFQQWYAMRQSLEERRIKHKDYLVGDTSIGNFDYNREKLIDAVGNESSRVVDSYDKEKEARKIAESAQTAVAATAVLEVGAIGLGALIATLATTVAADVTGVLLASMLAVLGLLVIPARKRQANKEMSKKISEMRLQLVQSLDGEFQKEIQRSLEHIQKAITPYSRFVRTEHQKLIEANSEIGMIQTRLKDLKIQVEAG